jgi:hypothetical protein
MRFFRCWNQRKYTIPKPRQRKKSLVLISFRLSFGNCSDGTCFKYFFILFFLPETFDADQNWKRQSKYTFFFFFASFCVEKKWGIAFTRQQYYFTTIALFWLDTCSTILHCVTFFNFWWLIFRPKLLKILNEL